MTRDRIGLYVHIPFCTAKCGYCDFNSYEGQEHAIPAYDQALALDAALWGRAAAGRRVDTVFFGGGTPSLTPPDEMSRILAALRESFEISDSAEVSLEANPGSIDAAYLGELRALGVNRLSIGVQSFDDDELLALDRLHSGDDARRAVRAAREAGFDNVNVDLIYGLPEQLMSSWRRTLETAISLRPEHISAYALTVEEGTPLARDVARGRVPPPDGDAQADMYEWTQERLARGGYEHYEISNWAMPGRRCAHNLVYWQNREYLGLGAGAHSFFGGARFSTVLIPSRYIELVQESAAAADGSMRHVVAGETITPTIAMSDELILGLRLNDGLDEAAFAARYGISPGDAFGEAIEESLGYGLLERAGGRLRLTARGRLLSNEVFTRLLPREETQREQLSPGPDARSATVRSS